MLVDTLLVSEAGCDAYPVGGRYWRGSSQILQEDSEVVSYCIPQVEHIMRSREAGMFAVQKFVAYPEDVMLLSLWLRESSEVLDIREIR